jgi:hypothetical protein
LVLRNNDDNTKEELQMTKMTDLMNGAPVQQRMPASQPNAPKK